MKASTEIDNLCEFAVRRGAENVISKIQAPIVENLEEVGSSYPYYRLIKMNLIQQLEGAKHSAEDI